MWFCSRFSPLSSRIYFPPFESRARMFLICSRSFSLSRPAACLPSATTLLSGSQKWKKESLSPHLFFLARKAGWFSYRRPRFCCVVLVLLVGSLLFRIRTASSVITTHSHTYSHTYTRATNAKRNGKKNRKILFLWPTRMRCPTLVSRLH